VANRGPLVGMAALVAVVGVGVVLGGVIGVGPLAATTPPDQVTDPKEMIARGLQATLDASAAHLDITLTGTVPGALVNHAEPSVTLDGTTSQVDILPKDARTKARVDSPALDIGLDTVTVWDSAWYRTSPDGPWTKASVGGASAEAGVDINPLTLVDRLRSYLARPDLNPTVTDVACASTSGTCRHIVLEAGTDPADILGAFLPDKNSAALPAVRTTITMDADAKTLRPAHLVLAMASDDGSVDLELVIDASKWDEPVQIEEPPKGS
jgi:hypothetical protein